jgi:aspartyl-tRNA(Asn)/glutamyl-tRNA(Gln) amidotransferase subunit A
MPDRAMTAPIAQLIDELAHAKTSSIALTEASLASIEDPAGEGGRTFTKVYRSRAMMTATASDAARAAGIEQGPLAGVPISIKDLFDVADETTRAGSKSRDDAPAAAHDATIVARLRAAGAVIVGKTTMSEFAYSGLGLNPHDGTPRCAWDRAFDDGRGRAPGGSSSGAGVSVADGMVAAAIGTDTGGSVRIPAAFNGIVGFKPTARRVPTTGCFPLSATLDSIGPLARTVECCARVDAVLAGESFRPLTRRALKGLRIGMMTNVVLDDLDAPVASDFERAVASLSASGASITSLNFTALDLLNIINAKGGFAAAEAWHLHRKALETREHDYDPRVALRIRRGAEMSAADYLDVVDARRELIAAFETAFEGFDAWIAPTLSRIAQPLAPLERDVALFGSTNLAVLRNPSIINVLDGCAVTLPIQRIGEAPVGLMVFGPAMHDRAMLAIAAAIEGRLAASR